MELQVVTVQRNQGVGRESKRPFNFVVVGGLMTTARGTEFCEVMLDGDAPVPEVGKRYGVEMSFYPDRNKRLAFRVEALRPVVQAK